MKIKNSYYEGLLQDLFCEKDGFFAVFLHFLYQFNQIFVFYPNFKSDFEKLYMLELESCNLISRLINEIGGDAKFYSSNKKIFCGNIDYLKHLPHIVDMDIELVEKSLIDLKNALYKIDNILIKTELRKILPLKEKEEKILKDLKIKILAKNK